MVLRSKKKFAALASVKGAFLPCVSEILCKITKKNRDMQIKSDFFCTFICVYQNFFVPLHEIFEFFLRFVKKVGK